MIVPIIGEGCHKYNFCRDKRFVATKVCLSRQIRVCRDKHNFARKLMSEQAYVFVATKHVCLSVEYKQQNTSVSLYNIILSRQKFIQKFCRGKHTFVARKDVCCRDKHVFVATKLLSRQK